MRQAWPLALTLASALLLVACSGTPKKPQPAPDRADAAATPDDTRKQSPYAPAQEDPSKRGNYTAGGLYAPGVADSAPDMLPDVDAIPEPEVVHEPRSRYGNRSPYEVLGKSYRVLDSAEGYRETGMASYYGQKFHGRRTSNLEVYDMYAFTAAHKSLPLPSFARVTNLDNGRSVVVRVNDRGPFHAGRIIDLSYAAAVKLDIHTRGTGRVEVVALSPGDARERTRYAEQAVASQDAARTQLPVAMADNDALQLPPGVRIATGRPRPSPSAMDRLVEGLPGAAESVPASSADAAGAIASAAPAAAASGDLDWRFDMRQDGRAMTADEFDAWMKSRRARVATGRAGTPDPYGSAAPAAEVADTAADEIADEIADETAAAAYQADAAQPLDVPQGGASGDAAADSGVTVQVAAFGSRANAERALSMLRGAGVTGARLLDGVSAGKPVWRVRVGPIERARIAELSDRVAGLGFGQPQIVRE